MDPNTRGPGVARSAIIVGWLLLILGAIALLANAISGWIWLAALLAPSLALEIYEPVEVERRKKAAEQERDRPCHHGIAGAVHEPARCAQCAAEIERRRAEEERREAEAKARRAAEQQRDWHERNAKLRMPEYLKQMHPQDFERLICELYEREGYTAEATPYSGDGGVDAYLRRSGKLALLQCKRVQGSVGEPVLRDLFGAMAAHKADEGLVVTTGKVSRQAKAWVSRHAPDKIRIVEMGELLALLRSHYSENAVVPDSFEVFSSTAGALGKCPMCGMGLRRIKGRRGRFVGCSGYPQCGYTRPR